MIFLVCRCGQKVVSYAIASLTEPEACLVSIAIAPDFQRQGLGTSLIEAIKTDCIKKGIVAISLHVRTTNTAAVALYQHLGFAIIATIPAYYADNSSAFYMKLFCGC